MRWGLLVQLSSNQIILFGGFSVEGTWQWLVLDKYIKKNKKRIIELNEFANNGVGKSRIFIFKPKKFYENWLLIGCEIENVLVWYLE